LQHSSFSIAALNRKTQVFKCGAQVFNCKKSSLLYNKKSGLENSKIGGKIMDEEKNTQPDIQPPGIEPKDIRQSHQPPHPPQGSTPPPHPPEPVGPPLQPGIEDWRMNREWCLNQALDIVKSLTFEVKDVPAFLDAVYRKIVELANDARKGGSV